MSCESVKLVRRHFLQMTIPLAVLAGCDEGPSLRPDWAMVSGTVSYRGQPLPGGEVIWCTEKDGAAIVRGGAIREDGSFELDAPIGPAKVAIHTEDVKAVQPARFVEIPAKYSDPDQSGLTYEVRAGENSNVQLEIP